MKIADDKSRDPELDPEPDPYQNVISVPDPYGTKMSRIRNTDERIPALVKLCRRFYVRLCVRYYTVPKKETKKFHRDSGRNSTEPALVRAVENALAFLDEDVLPVHWDR